MNVNKTFTYIERSRSLPLDVVFFTTKHRPCLKDALCLTAPHIRRFKSFTMNITGPSDFSQGLNRHFALPAPLLKELTIQFNCHPAPVLDTALFDGDLSSLQTLNLGGVITHLPWKNLWNLTTFKLRCVPDSGITVTRLLNFIESAPRLQDIRLRHSIPKSNSSPGWVVSPPHLKNLTIFADLAHSNLLNHLSIPAGVQLFLHFKSSGDKSPLPDLLPQGVRNLKNLFRITAVNICLDKLNKLVRLDGPSGGLRIFGGWRGEIGITPSFDLDH